MYFFKTILLHQCLLFLFQTIHAQTPVLPGYTMQIFGASNGLPSSEVVSLYQDVKDFIWIGTREGISRYDGYRFQNFEYINNIRIGTVYCITEDKDATLWMSCETGLYYWEGKKFVHRNFKNQTPYLPFSVVHFAEGGDVWLGTLQGPVHFPFMRKEGDDTLEKRLLPNWKTIARNDWAVNFIHSSKKGVVIGAYGAIYLYQNKVVKNLPNPYGQRDYLRDVFIDDAGVVYWNNLLTGFHYWNGKETVKPVNSYGYFFDIVSKDGKMYLYNNAGIMEVEAITKHTKMLVDIAPLELRSPSCMFIDKEGSYWVGAAEGLFRIKKNLFTTHWDRKLRYTDDTYSLLRRRNGELLVGTNRGHIFIMKDSLQPYANGLQVVPNAEVFSMYEDDKQNLWFGTGYQGIALYKNGRLKNFTTQSGLPDNSHYSFYKSNAGEFWSAGDMGLTRIKKGLNDSVIFQPFFYNTPVDYHKVYGITEAPDGTIWAGGQLGLFYIEDTLCTYSLPELHDRKLFVTAIKQDKQGNVWLSTRGHGILCCTFGSDHKLHLKYRLQEEDGLATNTYLSLAFDENNNVWAGSFSGITALQRGPSNAFNIKNFDVRDGFISKNYQSLNMFADGNTMWACTSSGAVSFQPALLLQQTRKAQLHITSIDLLNTKSTAEEFLVRNKTSTEKFYQFPHSINSFSIQFAALYYTNPDAIHYYYQLQNIDSNWTSTGSEQAIRFRQLPPGNYKLLIKAAVGGSDWTNTVIVPFTIKSPWWLQWWIIASTVLLSVSVLFFFARGREKRARKEEQQKTAFEKLKATSYQHQLEIEQVINYFATSLNGHTTIDSVLWDVARNCISQLGFDDCVIYLKNDMGNKLVQKAAWGPKTTKENRIINPIEIAVGKGIVGTVALTGKAEKINDTSTDSRYIIDDVRRASEITVPIFEDENVIGIIDSEHSEKDFYTERHLHILTTIASHCGAKIGMLKAAAKASAARMEALLNKQKALEASLQSMRLQMNPHFLFNALNAIQRMILAGNEITATRFLSKFSKLLRMVLINSDREEVSLKEELELMHLYVELESLRFEESFSYSIECDEAIDVEEVFVPTLFFQPLVENAIWHGLMHKSGQRRLNIQFREGNGEYLTCIIQDNGIGRGASAAHYRTAQEHTGRGLSVALERIRTLNEMNSTNNSLEIIDLTDEVGMAAGTRIRITLYHL